MLIVKNYFKSNLKPLNRPKKYYLIIFEIEGIIATARAILNNSLGKKGYKPPASALSYPITEPK